MKKIATFRYNFLFFLVALLYCLDFDTVRAQETKKDTLYLNEWFDRQYNLAEERVISDMRFDGVSYNNYSAYFYRRETEINESLYRIVKKVSLKPRDRIKLSDRIFFTINNEYLPGFLQLYQMPIPNPPENPRIIYEDGD